MGKNKTPVKGIQRTDDIPKSNKKSIKIKTPQRANLAEPQSGKKINLKNDNIESYGDENKNAISQKVSMKGKVENETEGLAISFPDSQNHRLPMLELLDTDQPIILQEPMRLSLRYSDRFSALEAMEKLKDLDENISASLRFRDVHGKIHAKDKRLVHVPESTDVGESIKVLKKVFGASSIEQKTFNNQSRMMLLTFPSEEYARAADKIVGKSYSGMELVLSSYFEADKRKLDTKTESIAKKQKRQEDSDDDDDDNLLEDGDSACDDEDSVENDDDEIEDDDDEDEGDDNDEDDSEDDLEE